MEKSTPPITREAALRIALAARAMPNASLPALIDLIQRRLGDDIDEDKLRQVTVTMLKTGGGQGDPGRHLSDQGAGRRPGRGNSAALPGGHGRIAAEKRLKNYSAQEAVTADE